MMSLLAAGAIGSMIVSMPTVNGSFLGGCCDFVSSDEPLADRGCYSRSDACTKQEYCICNEETEDEETEPEEST